MYKTIDGILVWGDADERTMNQIKNCAKHPSVYRAMLMADNHLGYAMPVGGVVAYKDAISPSGVGYDISCGIKAVRTKLKAYDIYPQLNVIMDEIFGTLSFGIGRKNNTPVDHPLFHDDPAWSIRYISSLKQLAQNQLGTIGSGNHFVDLLVDEDGWVWIATHFGSRGLGHKIATDYIHKGGGKDGIDVEPVVLPASNSYLGEEYIAAMKLAGRYAYAGRDWVCETVANILDTEIVEMVHNHHNFAWAQETADGPVWVVRKGATPAMPGQRGFVGGSMGDVSYVVEGLDTQESEDSLFSTIHGAGRSMSRTAAKGKIHRKTGRVISEGAISKKMMDNWLNEMGVVLRGAGTDEAPQAYKRIGDVIQNHLDSVKIVHVLSPIGVAMAGENEIDPFRD